MICHHVIVLLLLLFIVAGIFLAGFHIEDIDEKLNSISKGLEIEHVVSLMR